VRAGARRHGVQRAPHHRTVAARRAQRDRGEPRSVLLEGPRGAAASGEPLEVQPDPHCEQKGAALEKSSGLAACNQFHDAGFFDAVVDFSSRNHQEVRQVAGLLSGRVGVYVFVSSHLVYRVSRAPDHDGPLLESDAVRPGREVSPLAREQARGIDARGDGDLDCETELMKQYNAGGFPFVVLLGDA
ncbi:unnamed protein product, partial [Prorocentrum cordatum]